MVNAAAGRRLPICDHGTAFTFRAKHNGFHESVTRLMFAGSGIHGPLNLPFPDLAILIRHSKSKLHAV